MQRIVVLTFSILLTQCGALPQEQLNARVDDLFSEWSTSTSPGAVLAVIQEGKIVYERAYGMADLERDVPLSVKSVFDIASTSKQFVAFSVLLLEEDEKLSLDDDIRRYIPVMPEYSRPVTIRHLIHHTSGIRDYMDLMELAGMSHENTYDPSEIVGLVARQKALNFDPGEEFSYSNSGYLLLAEIVEEVSGQTLGDFAKARIFEPLEMDRSQFYDDFTRIVKNRALSYSRRDNGEYASVQYIFDVIGDTGLLTTVEDLFLWDQNFYANKLGGGGQKLIERMLTRGRLNNGEELDYAFGLELEEYRGLQVVKHSGSAAGYRSQILRFPDQRFTVIILSNLAEFSPTKIAERVADLYLEDEFVSGSPAVETKSDAEGAEPPESTMEMGVDELTAYTGNYYSSELDAHYSFRVADGNLVYSLRFSPTETRLSPKAPDAFEADRLSLQFQRSPGGTVRGLNLSFWGIRDIYFEKHTDS